MLNGLLVDYGGVLTSPVVDSFAGFCAREAIDAGLFRSVILDAARENGSPFARVETGEISQDEFDAAVAQLLGMACGRAIESKDLKQRLFADIRPDQPMLDAVRAARAAGIRTALVSNSWGGRDYPRDGFAEIFDEVVISGEVGLRKPEPAIYRLAAERAGVDAGACVFVDDFRVNIEGAEAVGMTGVLHRTAEITIPKLEELLGAALR